MSICLPVEESWSCLNIHFVCVRMFSEHNANALYIELSYCILMTPVVWCVVARILSFRRSPTTPWFTVLLLFHTDKLFTPHQRRLLPAEQHLSALSIPLFIPSLYLPSVFAFLSSSCFRVSCIPSLVQNPRNFLRCVRNKHPSFYVSFISSLCPFILFNVFLF